MARTPQIQFTPTPKIVQQLRTLAERKGISISAVIRIAITEYYQREVSK